MLYKKSHFPIHKQSPTPAKGFVAAYIQTLIVAVLLVSLGHSNLAAQTILIDDFEDGDLVANNYCYWTANAWAESVHGEVLNLENADDGTGNRALHASIQAGTGSWRTAEILLKLAWDQGSGDYKSYVDYGYDLRSFEQIRFKAKSSPTSYGRFEQVSCVIPDYKYYYKSLGLSSIWTQFVIDFSQLVSSQGEVTLEESLQHTDELKIVMYPSSGTTVEMWIDDIELVCDPNYEPPELVDIPSGLKEAAESKGLKIGFAPTSWHMADEPYMGSINNNSYFILSGWATGQAVIQRFPYYWDFAMADATLKWSCDHGKTVMVQHLVWHGSTPEWIINGGFSPAEVNDIMREFIQESISHYNTHYPDTVTHYSVVNEAITDSTYSYRQTFWYNELGPEYITKAFTFAHQADPNAKLYYNDYGIDGINPKSDAVYNMVSDLLDEGVPIHGVGLQMHIFDFDWYPGKQSVLDNMERFGQLDLEVYITEMDVAINADLTGLSDAKLSEQATIYRQIVEACVESPYCNYLTIFGITDKYSWLLNHHDHDDWPLVLDENFQPKPAWCAIMEELSSSGDLDTDCQVNMFDVGIFVSQWLDTGDCSAASDCADLDGDSNVDFQDYSVMAQNYGH